MLSRVRQALFDVLRPRLAGARFCDLFGGSGAIAFEALSNGAARAAVVDLDPAVCRLVESNRAALGLSLDRASVHCGDALEWIETFSRAGERFDVVCVAPPYRKGLVDAALARLAAHPLLAEGGWIVCQHHATESPAFSPARFEVRGRRLYGHTALLLLASVGVQEVGA